MTCSVPDPEEAVLFPGEGAASTGTWTPISSKMARRPARIDCRGSERFVIRKYHPHAS